MAETIGGLIAEAKKSRYSLIPSLSEEDVLSIWEAVSGFVERQMVQQKGVTVPCLGAFTFSQKKIDVGSNKFIVIQRPVFVVSERFAQTHSLHYTKQHTSGQIPIVPLNFTILANETSFDRDTVETSVKEVLQALSRSLAAKKNIEFDFSGIGRLAIQDGKVKMKFFREFILTLDSSGEMENAFRPGTARSELSIMSRPSTTATLTLPRIVEPSNSDALNLECSTPRPPTTSSTGTTRLPLTQQGKMVAIPELMVEEREGEGDTVSLTSSSPTAGRTESRRLVPKPAGLFASQDSSLHFSGPRTAPGTAASGGSRVTPRSPKGGGVTRKSSSTALSSKRHFTIRPSTCSYSSQTGQELCYLCHQRALKNIPVDVSGERQDKERRQDQLLQEYQHQKDLIALAREQTVKMVNGGYNKEIASFNLQAAETKKADSCKSAKWSEFHPSYVFEHRAPTPAKHLKQREYCSQLDGQVGHRQAALHQAQEAEEKLEREEKLQLAKELASYQEAYQMKNAMRMAQYQKALAEQVRMKPAPLTPMDKEGRAMHHQPVFGIRDVSSEKLKQEKDRARSLFLEQLSMVASKQQRMKEKALQDHHEEADMLKRTRNSLIDDQSAERKHKYEARSGLELAWNECSREKQHRLLEELQQSKEPSILLHQQCEKYLRCKQCQRQRHNAGKSNLLCESRYISGSRLMV